MTTDRVTPIQPIRETVRHHLGNAAMLAEAWADAAPDRPGDPRWEAIARGAFVAIRDHLSQALTLLGEPTPETVRVTTLLMEEALGDAAQYVPDLHRLGRDTAAIILHTQVTGHVPAGAFPKGREP